MEIRGTYPMLYAFFDAQGHLRRDAFTGRIAAAIASGASGIAALGLGTEVAKRGRAGRREISGWVISDVAGRLPVAVTIADGNVPDILAGTGWRAASGPELVVGHQPALGRLLGLLVPGSRAGLTIKTGCLSWFRSGCRFSAYVRAAQYSRSLETPSPSKSPGRAGFALKARRLSR